MKLIKNITRVLSSNLIMMLSNVILGFVLPIFISVKSYGEYRLYLFYIGYTGFLHFGYIDYLYLKYGGKEKDEINKGLLKKEHNVFVFYQIAITIVTLLIAYLLKNKLYAMFALTIVPLNIFYFHNLVNQATGQFKKYSKSNIIFTLLNLILICIFIFMKEHNAYLYMNATILAYLGTIIFQEFDFFKMTKNFSSEGNVSIFKYTKVGIFVLLGNLCVVLISSLGRWIVQFFMDVNHFAYYSFAISMMSIVLMLINAVGLTFYNYISKNENEEILRMVKDILIILGVLGGSVYFVLEIIVNSYLPKYKESLDVIAISFISFPYMMVINVIISNIYKARKQEKKYLKVVSLMLLIAVISNLVAFSINQTISSIAYGTLISFVFWYLFTVTFDFKYLKIKLNEAIYLIAHIVIFLLTSSLIWYKGLVVYLTFTLVLTVITYQGTLLKVWHKFKVISPKKV